MTATLSRTTPSLPPADHRVRPPLRALSVVAGGVLFAVGNALHPLEHNDGAPDAPTRLAAHPTSGAGALLMAAGIGALFGAWPRRGSR
jgi:hypothetical protein